MRIFTDQFEWGETGNRHHPFLHQPEIFAIYLSASTSLIVIRYPAIPG
jgi:hypothetical protein